MFFIEIFMQIVSELRYLIEKLVILEVFSRRIYYLLINFENLLVSLSLSSLILCFLQIIWAILVDLNDSYIDLNINFIEEEFFSSLKKGRIRKIILMRYQIRLIEDRKSHYTVYQINEKYPVVEFHCVF